jgi:predicted unusual protein kinase regulating ubiquinone biosynthesis (AarF/ABC1/UbiB family)
MSMRLAAKSIRTGAKIFVGGTLGVSAASTAATYYLYETNKSYQRLIDFHILFTPMCWDYYKYYAVDNGNSRKKDHDDSQLVELHQKYAKESLKHILQLGGYYVKCAQMFCGMNMLPPAYEKEYSILLDNVPPKPYEVIEKIVLEELGGNSISDHFESFDLVPIAAASIGQVHCARLKPNPSSPQSELEVVVKIQYPEVEEFFHMDVLGMKNLCLLCARSGIDIGVEEKSLNEIFDQITKSFEDEFDYRKEAKNMKLVHDNMMKEPQFASRVKVPLPINEKTTKKVLTMEKILGTPIKHRMKQIMEEYASKVGKSIRELEDEFKSKLQDPAELEKILSKRAFSKTELFFYCAWLKTTDIVTNGKVLFRNTFVHKTREPYKWSTPPLDAAEIISLLYAIHAHQVFVDGAFNADPHAGNILLCEDEGLKLGLIDFGNVQQISDPKRRVDLARFYLSMAKDFSQDPTTWNDEKIAKRFADVGGTSVKSDVSFLAANALMMYDIRYDSITLARYGILPDMSNMADVLYGRDEFEDFPADLINLQRLSQTLLGVAGSIGAGQPSCARMWKRQCLSLVEDD